MTTKTYFPQALKYQQFRKNRKSSEAATTEGDSEDTSDKLPN